jgi:hypothetical protein
MGHEMKAEEWRPVLNYEGLYEVSDQGKVRSLDRAVSHPRLGVQNRKGHVKRQCTLKNGYLGVSLCKNGKEVQKKVHILVAEAFLGSRPAWSTMINHKDKVVTNNHVENLEWSNNGHNKRHANARYMHDGLLLSCSDLAEIAGIPPLTMYRRLNVYGWTVQQAVSHPVGARVKKHAPQVFHLYRGKPMSYTELSEISGIPKATLCERITKRNWSVEKAVKTPVQLKRKSK